MSLQAKICVVANRQIKGRVDLLTLTNLTRHLTSYIGDLITHAHMTGSTISCFSW